MRRIALGTLVVLVVVALAAVAFGSSSDAPKRVKVATPSSAHASTAPSTRATTSTRPAPSTTQAPTTTTTVVRTSTSARSTTTGTPTPPANVVHAHGHGLAGAVITIDPGHNGGNASHLAEINKLVDIGTGMKPCNTTGTETNDGYPEHAFTWDVGQRVVAKLRALGAIVVLTHPNDTGWGPCSVDRAAIANRAHSAAAVSIHADGGPASGHGFHVISPPSIAGLTDDIAAPSARLATAVHDAMVRDTPFPPSTYVGSNGFVVSSTYGGLNRADVPAIFVECANMRNAGDAALIETASVRDQIAQAIVDGIAAFVGS